MIEFIIINFITSLSILGYAAIYKQIIYLKSEKLQNIDFIYGLIFIYFISQIFHFFSPLKYFVNIILVLGLIYFILYFYFKKISFSLINFFFVLLLVTFFTYYTNDNVDGPLYHLQILSWLQDYKLTFGIANLENRFGSNYPWHSIIAILSYENGSFSNKHYIISLILVFIVYEVVSNKKNLLSNLFLFSSLSYLFLFSLIHPFNYGTILNHFGNTEKDIFNMLIFFFSIFIFLRIIETKKNESHEINRLLNLLFAFSAILLMQSPQYFFLIFLVLFFYIKKKEYKLLNLHLVFLFLIFLLWLVKSLVISGCLIFPHSFTCFDFDWSLNKDSVDFLMSELKRHNRSLPSKALINDIAIVLHPFKWIIPWFKDYYLTTFLHQINSLIYILFILLFIFLKKLRLNIDLNIIFLIITLFLVNLTCFIAPEIRYAWGPHISLSSLMISLLLINLNLSKVKNIQFAPLVIFFMFLLFKISPKFEISHLYLKPVRTYDFSKKEFVGNFDGYNIFYNHWKCADLKDICINVKRKNFRFVDKANFTFISRIKN